jgi:CMP/dCMP kinase
MIITIFGVPGAGKTTVGKKLANRLDYDFLSGGDIRGEIAKGLGLTIDELNELAKEDQEYHRKVDREWKRIAQKEDNKVIDSWIAYHFIPNSFKVYLDVKAEEGAKRVYNNQRSDEKPQDSIETTQEMLRKRVESTAQFFSEIYHVDFQDKLQYDLYINTTSITIDEVVGIIYSAIEDKIKAEDQRKTYKPTEATN